MCAVFFVTSAALVARFTWDGAASRSGLVRWGAVAAGLGALIGAVTWIVWGHLPKTLVPYHGDDQRIAAWIQGAFVLLYIAVPFAQIFQASGRARFPYSQLFEHSWNNFFIGLVAVFFTAAVWSIVGIWGSLFEVIGIEFFQELFTSLGFVYLCTFASFGLGLSLGRANAAVISTLRRITLMVAQVLLPLVAAIALLFLAALPATGLEPLWQTGRATPLALALSAFFTVLLNGVYEEGERRPDYPSPLIRVLEVAVLLMPAYAAIALYGTGVRVSQYGLTPARFYALLFGAVASIYAVGYSVAVLRHRPPWLGTLKPVNVGAALFVAALAIAVQLPLLDPLRLSAENQAARLREGRVAASEFDFATLRFQLGRHGWEQLAALEVMTAHPEAEIIRESVARVRAAESIWTARQPARPDLSPAQFRTLPEDLAFPPGLLEAIARDRSDLSGEHCERLGCTLLGVDLERDGGLEYCVWTGSSWRDTPCYRKAAEAGAWEFIGKLAFRGRPPSRADLEAASRAGRFETRTPRYRDIITPGGLLELVPPAREHPLD